MLFLEKYVSSIIKKTFAFQLSLCNYRKGTFNLKRSYQTDTNNLID